MRSSAGATGLPSNFWRRLRFCRKNIKQAMLDTFRELGRSLGVADGVLA